ncbi:MAG: UDP-N-acetylmuramate dehydrogenase [Clostridia bacterium]|nr:UDP-N-acetylmuramate dehydrogenase [Clostridia bacterium]MBR5753468.1 UDP-N-acetylmuramate dehydrogenase [Clostridia bacterium]
MFDTILATAEQYGCNAVRNAPMSQYTTFKVGGPVDLLVEPDSEASLAALLKACKADGVRPMILGRGSNLLVPDEGLPGVAIHMGEAFSSVTLTDEGTILAEAGATVIQVCRFALEQSLSGLEFAFGIPGSVGGGIYMNAGAYGGEVGDYVVRVRHMDFDGNPGTWTAEEAGFSYRHSNYMTSDLIVTSVELRLEPGDPAVIQANMEDFMGRRKSKQPLEYGSAGSTFKRPEGYFAGALIEQCGLKGVSVGGAQVSEKHAGFVINKDNATAKDVLDLMALIRETVQREHGVTLEPEVRILGDIPWNS